MKLLILFAMLVVSASALFGGPKPPTGPINGNGPGPTDGGGMPDMGLVMSMVRQILMMLLPKLMANPSLMSTLAAGGKGPVGGKPPMPPMGPAFPMPGRGPSVGPPPMQAPPPMAMGPPPMNPMNPMNVFRSNSGHNSMVAPPPVRGANGAFMSTSSDTMKDMRLMELLQDPTMGFAKDPYVRNFIPRGHMPWGWSLPDMAKDRIMMSVQRRISRRGTATPKEQEIISLIGDPVEMMPAMFGPGPNMRRI